VTLATIPGGIAGYLLQDYAKTVFRNPALIGVMIIAMGIVLWAVDRFAKSERALESMTLKDAVVVGIAQMFAIIPGVSRSGSTITAGRGLAFSREAAAVFSFLLSLPIITAAVIFEGRHAIEQGVTAPLVVGVLASAVSGWLAISVLLKFIARNSYGIFAVYRLVIGAGVLALVAFRG
jgi:undecaprenyl-diphosphatase